MSDADVGGRSLLSRRVMQTVVTAGLALYFTLDLLLGGGLRNYINVELQWLLILAAALFALLALAALWDCGRIRRGQAGHIHGGGKGVSLALLTLPLILALANPATPLGADAARGNLNTSLQASANYQTLQRDPLSYNLLDWLRAFSAEVDLAQFDGQEAQLLGFVYREPNYPEDIFLLARITLSCCVADASGIGLPVHYADAASLKADQWVEVRGRFLLGEFNDEGLPILQAEEITLTEAPAQPYLYP